MTTQETLRKNPFSFEPIEDDLFKGREYIISEIQYYLSFSESDPSIFYNLLIIGASGSGKTSLINYIKAKSNENYKKRFISIHIFQSNLEKDTLLFREILNTIRFTLDSLCFEQNCAQDMKIEEQRKKLESLKKVDDELDLTLEITSILNELSMIAKNLGLGPIILIFDDADALVKHENLIRSLKSIFSELDGYNLIFLGTEASRCKMKIFPRLYAIEIPYFSDTNEIKSCIMEHLTSDEKMIINDKVFEEILNLSQGCPRIVMLIAHYMYKEFLECEDRKEFSELNFYVLNNVRFQLDTQNLDKEIYEKVSAAIEKKLERMKERAKYNDPRFAMSTGVRMNRTNGPLDQIR